MGVMGRGRRDKRNGLTGMRDHLHMSTSAIALEQRFMFDAAGVATAVDAVPHDPTVDTLFDTTDHAVDQVLLAAAAQATESGVTPTSSVQTSDAGTAPQPTPEFAVTDATTRAASEGQQFDTSGIAAANDESHEIAFIDTGVADWEVLRDNLRSGVEAVLIDPTKDGVQQVADYLLGRTGVESIHIISHGQEARLLFGTSSLEIDSISGKYADALATIGSALSSDGDILLYGCDIGRDASGKAFLDSLAEATSADVVASIDDTGSAAEGGNWDLERVSGNIETSIAITNLGTSSYNESLATLVAGDIAIIQVSTINKYFVFAPLVNIDANTSVIFTDRTWSTSLSEFLFNSPGSASSAEFAMVWVPTASVTAGTLFKVELGNVAYGTTTVPVTLTRMTDNQDVSSQVTAMAKTHVSTTLPVFVAPTAAGTNGDNLLVLTGTMDGSGNITPTTQIYGVSFSEQSGSNVATSGREAGWYKDATAIGSSSTLTNISQLPSSLTNGTNALSLNLATGSVGVSVDNFAYNGPTTATSRDGWLTRIVTISNYAKQDSTDPTLGPISGNLLAFTGAADTTPPGAPTTAIDLVAASDSGASSTDNITNSTTPTFRVSLTGTSAVAGDVLELLLGGSSFGTPVTRTLTGADITNTYYDFTLSSGALGADGSKALTAKVTDIAGNAGTAGGSLTITLDTAAPTLGTVTAANITSTAASSTFTVAYSDSGSGIDSSSIGTADVTLTSSTISNASYNSGTATYTITPPGSSWDSADNGTFTIALVASQVTDVAGNAVAASSNIKQFTVNISSTDSTTSVTAGSGVSEPVTLATTVTTAGAAVNVFDFKITDNDADKNGTADGGTTDGLATTITQIALSTSGTGDFSKVTWLLAGSGITGTATGTYNSGKITFSGLNLSVADNTSQTYTVSAFYNNNAGLTEGQTFVLTVDGDQSANFTVGGAGSQMAASQTAVDNGAGSTVGVTATKLLFATQPASSVSGVSLTQPVVRATDAAGNIDADFTGTVTLSEVSAGELSGTSALAAVAGVATFTNVIYSATADQQTFVLTAASGALTSADSSTVTSDVVATKLEFSTQPVPLTLVNGAATSFTTVPVVRAVNAGNVVDTGYTSAIVLSVTNTSGGAVAGTVNSLGGVGGDTDGAGTTVTLNAASGAATFTGLSLTYTVGGGTTNSIVLHAASGTLTTVNSSTITASSNSSPIVDLNGGTAPNAAAGDDVSSSFTEAGGAVAIASAATISDAESNNITSLTVTLSSRPDGSAESLSLSSGATTAATNASLTVTAYNSSTGVLSITGSAAASVYQTILQGVQYNNTASSPTQTARGITVQAHDGTTNSTTRTVTMSVTDVTAATTTAGSFNTTTGANLNPGITFGSGNETLTIASSTHVTGSTADGGTGTDTLVAVDGVNLNSLTALTGFEALTVQASATVSMSGSQHNAFSTFNDAAGQTISLVAGSDAVTGNANIETYTLGSGYSGTFTLGANGQNVTGGTGNDTVNVGTRTLTAGTTLSGGDGTDTLVLDNGADISAVTVTGFENLTIAAGASVTMTRAQHAQFTGTITATGTQTITITGDGAVTTLAGVENYTIQDDGTDARTVTVSAAGTSVTATSATDAVTFDVGTLTYTGTLTGAGTNDTVRASGGASLTGGTFTNVTRFAIGTAGTVTVSSGNLTAFSTSIAGSAGSDTLALSGGGTFDFTSGGRTVSGIEGIALASNSAYTVTLGDNFNADGGTVTVTNTSGAAITGAVSINASAFAGTDALSVGSISLNGGVTLTGGAGADTLTGGSGNDTITGGSGNDTITGGGGADTIVGGGGDDVFVINGTSDIASGESYDGGTGNDTLSVTATTNFTGVSTLDAIETLTLAAGVSVTFDAAAVTGDTIAVNGIGNNGGESVTVNGTGNIDTINLSGLTLDLDDIAGVTINGLANADTITGTNGADTIDGGGGNDVFVYATLGAFISGGAVVDSITGGAGTDTVRITSTGAITIAAGELASRIGTVETLAVVVANTGGISITLNETDRANSGLNTIDLSGDSSATGTNTVNLSAVTGGAFTVTGSGGADTITGGAGADTIDAGAGDDTVATGGGNDTLTLGADANVVTIANNQDISGASITAAGGSYSLTVNGNATMTGTQHTGASSITASGGSDQITLTTVFSGTGAAAVETYVLADGVANSFTLGAAGQNVTGGTGADTVSTGAFNATGALALGAGANVVSIANNQSIAGLQGLSATGGSYSLTVNGNATMTGTQHSGASSITASGGSDQITFSGIVTGLTGAAAVETYVLADGVNNSFTLGAAGQNVTGGTGADTVNIGNLTATGALALGTGANVVAIGSGGNISGASISATSGTYALTLTGSGTMIAAQYTGATGITATGSSDQITFTTAFTGTVDSAVETVVLANATNSVTLGGNAQSVTGGTGADTVDVGTRTITGTLSGGSGTDTLMLGNGADISGANVSGFESLTIASGATVTMTAAQLAQFTGTITAAGTETINVTGNGNFTTLANVETFSVGDDSTNARTITVAQAGVIVSATSGSDAVTFNVGTLAYTGTLTGSGTNDIVQASGGANLTGGTFTNVTKLAIGTAGTVTVNAANLSEFSTSITGSAGSDTLALSGGGTFDFTAGSRTVSGIEGVALASNSVYTITLGDNFSINGGTLTVTNTSGAAITSAVSINASAFAGGDALSVGSISLDGGVTLTGGAGADTLTGGSGADTITGNGGADTIDGAGGDDTFVYNTGDVASGETLAGGAGTDTTSVVTSTSFANLSTATILTAGAVERILITSGQTATFTGAQLSGQGIAVNATTAGAATLQIDVASGGTVDFSSLTFTAFGGNNAFDSGTDIVAINGAAGNETITGTSIADIISAGAGTNSLTLGGGIDTVKGTIAELTGDTIADLALGEKVQLAGTPNLTSSNIRISSGTLQIDTDATTFASVEVSMTLTNTPTFAFSATNTNGNADTLFTANTYPTIDLNGSVNTGTDNTVTMADAANGLAAATATAADTENDGTSWNTGTLTLQRVKIDGSGSADGTGADVFSFLTGHSITSTGGPMAASTASNGTLSHGGTQFATWAYTNAGQLTATFTSAATSTMVRDLVRSIGYSNATPFGNASIRFTLNDGSSSTTADATVTSSQIHVTATADDSGNDAADGFSLREAITRAHAQSGTDTIVFGSALNGQTVTLGASQTLSENVTFQVADSTSVTLSGSSIAIGSGLTLTNTVGTGGTLTIGNSFSDSGGLAKGGAGRAPSRCRVPTATPAAPPCRPAR
jgi:Ca2+-binding RTX toxin-like protein